MFEYEFNVEECVMMHIFKKKRVYSILVFIVTIFLSEMLMSSSLDFLEQAGLYKSGNPLRLHLGCGANHLNGYVNIDFPPSEHTVADVQSSVDYYADITKLQFPNESVREIRSHHVFEHFTRACALALLCAWQQWLEVGGTLVIETPDVEKSMQEYLDPQCCQKDKMIILRHIFGSQEASWALHLDGWDAKKFVYVLEQFGFNKIVVKYRDSKIIPSVIVIAHKQNNMSLLELKQRAQDILHISTVDSCYAEEKMWNVWCQDFERALKQLMG
jgi:predicted SAM-dependent methyltransferase